MLFSGGISAPCGIAADGYGTGGGKCRLLEAKLDVVTQMQRDVENMLPPMAMAM